MDGTLDSVINDTAELVGFWKLNEPAGPITATTDARHG